MCTSVPQIEVFSTLIRTSLEPGSGTGTSVSSSPSPARTLEIARIVLALIGIPKGGPGSSPKQPRSANMTVCSGIASALGSLCPKRLRMMTNRFYGAFDSETPGGERKTDYRNAFQIDRDRIIHAQAFRKLQAKTQVFLSGEYDFYRTRLTHSMEVAQIGRSICQYLQVKGGLLRDDFRIDGDLVEAVCLAHDLGHPPFGHSGERTLQELMGRWGGFEGNAQTLHLLIETMYQDRAGVRGMQPTRSLMDGVLKYKTLHGQFRAPPTNHFLYDSQKE